MTGTGSGGKSGNSSKGSSNKEDGGNAEKAASEFRGWKNCGGSLGGSGAAGGAGLFFLDRCFKSAKESLAAGVAGPGLAVGGMGEVVAHSPELRINSARVCSSVIS
jgi:hypothetical protein